MGKAFFIFVFSNSEGERREREIEGWREVEAAGLVALMATKL
jgi:hypothetical protein